MFEALLTLCLLGTANVCTNVLLPGYEAPKMADCQGALARNPPELAAFADFKISVKPYCTPTPKPLAFTELAPGVFVHEGIVAEPDKKNQGDVANISFIVGEKAVAVIDSGASRVIGEGVWRAIRAVTDLPVEYVILTHTHPDHVLGAGVFADAGASVVGHAQLNQALSDRLPNYLTALTDLLGPVDMLGTRSAPTTLSVTSTLNLDLGGRVLELQAWPSAHTATDITVFDPSSGILFAGDLLFDQHTPALDGSLRGWQAVLKQLQETPFSHVVPGHGGPLLDWPQGGEALQRYLSVLAKDAQEAIASGERLGKAVEHIAASEAPHWQLFETFNPRNATVVYSELEWE